MFASPLAPRIRGLHRRYFALYGLFGVAVGIRSGADAWVYQVQSPGGALGEYQLMGFAMIGMLAGEAIGAWISDQRSRAGAVASTALAYAASSLASMEAIFLLKPNLLIWGGLAFGLGLGIQHSSLDAWLVATAKELTRSPDKPDGEMPSDAIMVGGYTTYTFGFFLGITLALPLLYSLGWSTVIATETGDPLPPPHPPLSPRPYGLMLVACLVALLLRPDPLFRDSADGNGGVPEAERLLYWTIIHEGGIRFLLIVGVGAIISILIQYVDAFGATDLIGGTTVANKAVGLAIVHSSSFVLVGLFGWMLRTSGLGTLSPAARTTFLAVSLTLSLILFLSAFTSALMAATIIVAIALGIGHSILNMLPQVVKWAVLDSADKDSEATASAILGIAKRVPNVALSFGLALAFPRQRAGHWTVFCLLIFLNVVGLFALGYYAKIPDRRASRLRRGGAITVGETRE